MNLNHLNWTILNNTFILLGGGLSIDPFDSMIVKNNLFIGTNPNADNAVMGLGYSDAHFASAYKDIDYNHYYFPNWNSNLRKFRIYNGTSRNWGQWQALGVDVHSDTGYISIADVRDSVILAYMPPADLIGTDVSAYGVTTDILGNERTIWSIGALEFGGIPPGGGDGIDVKSKIFLQGPFNSNSMSTTLTQSSLLPNSQPYNSPPWNYNGNENLGSGPNSTMVDWVLVELRSASNPVQIVARRAAILKNNGLLLNTNGSEGVIFNNVDPGSYYIAVYHRNHLAIMSSAPVPLSSNSALYDFTTGMNKAYGQDPMVELVPGKFGLYAADGDADGVVNNTDNPPLGSDYSVWLSQNGTMGYQGGDFNMNSGVTVHDVNQLLNINNGKTTQVP
jgi:hypothetical protein